MFSSAGVFLSTFSSKVFFILLCGLTRIDEEGVLKGLSQIYTSFYFTALVYRDSVVANCNE